ncbi:hypothetical protein [Myroides sp.]|uniref:hypothetical protein n=1 Tax=Myroides sp. TaxID=1874736 RepID=UPI003F39823C
METNFQLLQKQQFPKNLEKRLISSVADKQVTTIWYGRVYDSPYGFHILWLYVKDKTETAKVFNKDYSKTILVENKTHIVLLDDVDFEQHDKIGRAFTQLGLGGATLLYKDDNVELPRGDSNSYDINKYKLKYLETYNLLSSYCSTFMEDNIIDTTYLYLKFFEHDLDIIETILLGTPNIQSNLTERLLLLERVFPKIKTLFVKKEDDLYYIMDTIKLYPETTEDNYWALTLSEVQVKLNTIVIQLLDKLVFDVTPYDLRPKVLEKKKKEFKHLDSLLPLTYSTAVEEIYKFHKTVIYENDRTIKHFYLLVITDNDVTAELKNKIDGLNKKENDICFTSITHTRFYIQRYLYDHIDFFKCILQKENLIFSSDYYPDIHWMTDYVPDYTESNFGLKHSVSKIDKLIKKIVSPKKEGFISTNKLHKCLYIKLQMYVLFHTSYLPETKNLTTLFGLALYADNDNAPMLNNLISQFDSFLLTYTQKNIKQKNNNLILDKSTIETLKQFFNVIEA